MTMVTIAAIAPPEIPFDDDPLALATLFPADGVETMAEVELVVVVGKDAVLVGNTVEVTVMVVVEDEEDEEDEEVEVGVVEGVDIVAGTDVGSGVCTTSDVDVWSGRKAGSVEKSPAVIERKGDKNGWFPSRGETSFNIRFPK